VDGRTSVVGVVRTSYIDDLISSRSPQTTIGRKHCSSNLTSTPSVRDVVATYTLSTLHARGYG
jgi:hypothetical protein